MGQLLDMLNMFNTKMASHTNTHSPTMHILWVLFGNYDYYDKMFEVFNVDFKACDNNSNKNIFTLTCL